MLHGNELEFGIAFMIGGAGFAIFAIRLFVMDGRKGKYVPRHSAVVGVEHVPPEYHPVYDKPNAIFTNPFPHAWYSATVEHETHAEKHVPVSWFVEECEYKQRVRERVMELRERREKREALKNWKWLDVPWSEWKDLYPDRRLISV